MKNKRGLGKPGFFYLNSLFLIFEVFQMVLWLITSLLDNFGPQKIEESKLMRKNIEFLVLKENMLSIQSVFLFLTCHAAQTQNSVSIFLLNTLLKLSEKWAVQITLFHIPLDVWKRILNICEIPYIYDSFSSFLNVHQNL